jgi:hypothetical protein
MYRLQIKLDYKKKYDDMTAKGQNHETTTYSHCMITIR